MSFEVKGSPCPNCKRLLNGATTSSGRFPKPGDMTICLYCGHLSTFGDDLALREPNDEEMLDIAGDPRLTGAQKIRAAFLKAFPRDSKSKPKP